MTLISERIGATLLNAYLLTILAKGADILFFVGVFSFLAVEEVGVYSWALAIAAFFSIALDMGMNQTLVREFSAGTISFRTAFLGTAMVRIVVVALGIFLFVAWASLSNREEPVYLPVLLAALLQVFLVTEQFCFSWLKARHRQTAANLFMTLDPIGRVAALTILIYLVNPIRAPHLLYAILLVNVMITIAAVAVTRRFATEDSPPVPEAVVSSMRSMLAAGSVLFLISVVNVAQSRFDWLLVAEFVGKTELANYALANKGYEILQMFIGLTMLTVYPWICRQDGESRAFRTRINVVVSSLFILGVVAAVFSALYVPTVVELIWQDKYSAAKPLLHALLPVVALATAIMVLYYPLLAEHMEKGILSVIVTAAALQLVANLILIPKIGAFGAVVGMAVQAVVNYVGYSWLAIRRGIHTWDRLVSHCLFITGLLGTGAVLWWTDTGILVGGLTLAFFGGLAGYMLLIPSRERRWLTSWLYRKARRPAPC